MSSIYVYHRVSQKNCAELFPANYMYIDATVSWKSLGTIVGTPSSFSISYRSAHRWFWSWKKITNHFIANRDELLHLGIYKSLLIIIKVYLLLISWWLWFFFSLYFWIQQNILHVEIFRPTGLFFNAAASSVSKRGCQKLLSGFFPLRGDGGYPHFYWGFLGKMIFR